MPAPALPVATLEVEPPPTAVAAAAAAATAPAAAAAAAAAARPNLPRPFRNVGNSCFVNASVQAAFGLQTWRELLTRMAARRARPMNAPRVPEPLWTEEGQLAELREPHRLLFPAARPEDLLAATYHVARVPPNQASMLPSALLRRCYHGVQEDACEFMLGSFLSLDEELNPLLLPTLRGQLRTILRCADCAGTCKARGCGRAGSGGRGAVTARPSRGARAG